MTQFTGVDLNTDDKGIATSSEYGDRGDGTSSWFHWRKSAAEGLKADAAVTDPTLTATVISLLKGLLTFLRVSAAGLGKAEDAAHVSGDTGVAMLVVRKDTAAVGSGTTGDYEIPQTDSLGRLRVVDREAPSMAQTTVLATNLVVKASAGTLFGLIGYTTTAQFIQVHDASSLPADTAIPELTFPVAANTMFNIPLPKPHGCTVGIVICNSTTGATKTIGAADLWVTAYYI